MRLDQDYMVPTSRRADFMQHFQIGSEITDIATPALDGVFIYPDPRWVDNGNGMSTIQVTAYGRTRTGLQNQFLTQVNERGRGIAWSTYLFRYWNISGQACVPSGTSITLETLAINDDIFAPFDIVSESNPEIRALRVEFVGRKVWYQTIPIFLVEFDDEGRIANPPIVGNDFNGVYSYRIIITSDGQNEIGSFTIGVPVPQLVVTSQNNYGAFTEIDVSTRRGESQELIVTE